MNIDRQTLCNLINQLRHMHSKMHGKEAEKMLTCCVNCLHFNIDSELCKIAKARPPAKIIAFGCDSFEDIDKIPF